MLILTISDHSGHGSRLHRTDASGTCGRCRCTPAPRRRARSTTCLGLLAALCILLVISQHGLCSDKGLNEKPALLSSLRELAAINEGLISLVKMRYKVDFSMTTEPGNPFSLEMVRRQGPGNLRFGEVVYTRYNGLWAQDGPRCHSSTDFFADEERPVRSYLTVLDGEVMKWAVRPAMMQGSIADMAKFNWTEIAPCLLGIRPFEGEHLLSQMLTPEQASVFKESETVDEQEVSVVDIRKSPEATYYGRFWISREHGLPVRIEYYGGNPASGGARMPCRIDAIRHHRLPNGGWVPVEGTRSLYALKPRPFVRQERIAVDVGSITIRRADIPDSLFSLDFPSGATVYNDILNVTLGSGGDADRAVEERALAVMASFPAAGAEGPALQPGPTTSLSDRGRTDMSAARHGPNQQRSTGDQAGAPRLDSGHLALASACASAFLGVLALVLLVYVLRRSRRRSRVGSQASQGS